MSLYPVELRFGIGIGEITTEINTEMALGADGPGYYKAREAIEHRWTERQRKIIWNMLQYQDGQQKVADRLGITQATVRKALVKGNYYVYEKAMRNVGNLLGE